MPALRLPKPNTKAPLPAQRMRLFGPLLVIIGIAVLGVALVALPASLLRHALPAQLQADDFSGSVWHGSAGKLSVNGHDAGALEWRIHPLALLTLGLSADIHWVMVGFVADAQVEVDRHGLLAHDLHGGGPLEDLRTLGVGENWRGLANFTFSQLAFSSASESMTLASAVGELSVGDLSSPQVAEGVDLGSYQLHAANGAVTPDADATAEISDTGGPLQVQATVHLSSREHTGVLSGIIKERASAPANLRNLIDQLAQLHARDAQGRVPVDLEFTL
jgi:hypothetical protein